MRIYYFATEKYQQLNHERPLSYKCSCLTSKSLLLPNSQSLNGLANAVNTQMLTTSKKCFCLNDDTRNIYKRGANILFNNPTHFIQPSRFIRQAWDFNLHSNYYPIVIECVPVDALNEEHVHVTLAYLDLTHTVLNVPLAEQMTAGAAHLTTQSTRGVNEIRDHPFANNPNKSVSMGCIAQINYVYQGLF